MEENSVKSKITLTKPQDKIDPCKFLEDLKDEMDKKRFERDCKIQCDIAFIDNLISMLHETDINKIDMALKFLKENKKFLEEKKDTVKEEDLPDELK